MASQLSAAFDVSVECSPDITYRVVENTVYIRGLWPTRIP